MVATRRIMLGLAGVGAIPVLGSAGLYALTSNQTLDSECQRMMPYVMENVPETVRARRFGLVLDLVLPVGRERIDIDYTPIVEGKAYWTNGVIRGQLADYHWFCTQVTNEKDKEIVKKSVEAFGNPPQNYDLRDYLSPEGIFCGLEKIFLHSQTL